MKLTIIQTGEVPAPLRDRFGPYRRMFETMFDGTGLGFSYDMVAVSDGEPFPDPGALEGIVITGSAAGVYDDYPWLDPLRAFIRDAYGKRTPMLGVCFGHQIMADALGGDVRKSEKGWGVGRHTYEVAEARGWMAGAGPTVSLSVSHQDQVITPPAGAVTLARSAHTDHAMLAYTDFPAISVQGHPEFSDDFVAALYSARRGGSLTDAQVDGAIASLSQPEDNAMVGRWMARFLRGAR